MSLNAQRDLTVAVIYFPDMTTFSKQCKIRQYSKGNLDISLFSSRIECSNAVVRNHKNQIWKKKQDLQ